MGDGTEQTLEEHLEEEGYRFVKAVAQSGLARMIREKGVKGMTPEESEGVAQQVDRLTNREVKEKQMKKNIINQIENYEPEN